MEAAAVVCRSASGLLRDPQNSLQSLRADNFTSRRFAQRTDSFSCTSVFAFGDAEGTGGVFTYLKTSNDLVPMFQKLALGASKGQIFADVNLKGGVFVPFSTITIKIDVHSGSKVVSDSIDFIVPID